MSGWWMEEDWMEVGDWMGKIKIGDGWLTGGE